MTYGLQIQLIHGGTGDGFKNVHTYSPANAYEGYEYDNGLLVVHFDKAFGLVSRAFPLSNVICVEEFVIDPGDTE